MDVLEALQIADEVIFNHTGKHLDSLQQGVLRGVWHRQKYGKIAQEYQCSEGHVKDVASQLWKVLSKELGEDINKSNFRSTLERRGCFNISNFGQDFGQISNINLCGDHATFSNIPFKKDSSENNFQEKLVNSQDLAEMPAPAQFYGRTNELEILERWILPESCRLVAVSGMCGMGKTAVGVQLVAKVGDQFDFVIWRNLENYPSLETLYQSLIQFFVDQGPAEKSTGTFSPLFQLLKYFKKHRCLLILDNLQQIFSSGKLAGTYQAGLENYRLFFQQVSELSHQSCVLLMGWEPPKAVASLASENASIRWLKLDGLDTLSATKILQAKGLTQSSQFLNLIEKCQGNPLILKLIATLVVDLFNQNISEFISYNSLFLGEEVKNLLFDQYQRLSESEKALISVVAQEEKLAFSGLLESGEFSMSELCKIIQSLCYRALMIQIQPYLILHPLLKDYLQTELYEEVHETMN